MIGRWTTASVVLLSWLSAAVQADTLRVATFNAELSRKGPGLLLRDLRRGTDPQIAAVIEVITTVAPDILVLQGIDWDHGEQALTELAERLQDSGATYPHQFTRQTNRGRATGLDLDGDGRVAEAQDAQGYGRFTGQGGMAVLSRWPNVLDEVQDFTALLWRDMPGHIMPRTADGGLFPSPEAAAVQRLSNSNHWVVPVRLPSGTVISVLTYHAAPPVFDGPEDRNGRRNHDETVLWRHVLDGRVGRAPDPPFVIAGSATLDPFDSDGRASAIAGLLADPRVQDPEPRSAGAAAAPDQGHVGARALDTVDWSAPGPGRLRVDYVLPSSGIAVVDAGVFWPQDGAPGHEAAVSASRHRLVWVDLAINPNP